MSMADCPECGSQYTPSPELRFCAKCGNRLPGEGVATLDIGRVPTQSGTLAFQSGESGRSYELDGDRISIGSASERDIRIDHSSVSPEHGVIVVSQGRYVLFDVGSAGGTWVNGEPVTGAFLRNGSRLTMGSSELTFKDRVLTVRSGPSEGQTFPIGQDDVVIGREPGGEGARLDDGTVGRRQALVRPTPHGCIVFDMAGTNRTMVDGVPLRGMVLYDGDVIKVGEVELQFSQ